MELSKEQVDNLLADWSDATAQPFIPGMTGPRTADTVRYNDLEQLVHAAVRLVRETHAC